MWLADVSCARPYGRSMSSGSARTKDQLRRRLRPVRRAAARLLATDAVGLPPAGTVRPGSRPRRVKVVQRLAGAAKAADAPTVAVDGEYGDRTTAAVRALQRRLRLPPTGLADPLTVSVGLARVERLRSHAALGRANPVPRRTVLQLPVRPEEPGVTTTQLRHLVVEAPADQIIPRIVAESGFQRFEAVSTACYLAVLDHLGGSPRVFDVGANVGAYSHLAAGVLGCEVVAFEPTPALAATARRTVEVNGLGCRVEERALGRTSGVATFYLSDRSDLSSGLNPDFRPSTKQLTVPVETIDDYIERRGEIPQFVKIDAETTDADVLGGAQRLLEEHRPWVLVEVLDSELGARIQAEVDHLGYTFYPLHADLLPMHAEPTVRGQDDGRSWNWLLAPEPLPAGFDERVARWREAVAACVPVEPT